MNEAKYPRVIFDKKLRFKAHLQYITKKGTRAAMALQKTAEEHNINMRANYSKQPSQHVQTTWLSSSTGQKMRTKWLPLLKCTNSTRSKDSQ